MPSLLMELSFIWWESFIKTSQNRHIQNVLSSIFAQREVKCNFSRNAVDDPKYKRVSRSSGIIGKGREQKDIWGMEKLYEQRKAISFFFWKQYLH